MTTFSVKIAILKRASKCLFHERMDKLPSTRTKLTPGSAHYADFLNLSSFSSGTGEI
jgi:hypothetical protein